jgi:8-oxo-dGTP diphosphatase
VLYLVRHAHAGDKHAWPGPDHARPLSVTGRREAAGLVAQLAAFPISVILSSPSLRCRQTVQPLAADRGLVVQPEAMLRVDAEVDAVLPWLFGTLSHEAVWCTHGELIGGLLERLRSGGAPIGAQAVWPKGSVWLLEPSGSAIRSATYLPPHQPPRHGH